MTQRIHPPLTQLQVNHLLGLYSGGKLKEALDEAMRLCQTYPTVAPLHNIRGACYVALGQPDSAVVSYKRALEIRPDFAEAHNNLGGALKDLDRLDAAVASYERALEIKPDYAEAHNNLGNTLSVLGHVEASVKSFERAVEIKPDYALAHRNLSGLKKYQPDDAQIALMERLCSRPETDKSDHINLCFGLAKAYDDTGEVDKSFDYLAEGNRLRKKELNYNIGSDKQLFARIKENFGAESMPFGVVPIDEPLSIQPIFIVGMPRSGTSLVEQILASHSQVYGAGELGAMENFLSPVLLTSTGQVMGQQNNHLHQHDIAALRETYLKGLNALQVSEKSITDKMPLNFRWIGFILSAFPGAKIINLSRDPRATCWSNFKHYFPSPGIGYAYDMEDLAAFYKLYTDLMSFWRERFPNKIYDICYEDLTENQQEETRKLLEYCDLDWEERCLNFHQTGRAVRTASAAQVRQKIYTGSSEAWKRYEAYLQPLIKALGH